MKRVLYLALMFSAVMFQSCKEDEPAPTTTTDTDSRSAVVGNYDTKLTIYNAKSGTLKDEIDLFLQVQKDSKNSTNVLFYIDGLYLFMSAQNFRAITPGFAFDIPEQEVKNFGKLKGKQYINVDGLNERFMGVYYTSDKTMTVYMEKDNGGAADNDLYEFKMTKK